MERTPTLFDQQPDAAPKAVDLADVAAQIVANAPLVEHPERTSEAAREQGWGTMALPEIIHVDSVVSQEQQEVFPTRPKTRLELPRRERRNRGTQALTPREAQFGMTAEAIDRQYEKNKAGVATVRAALKEAAKKRV